jgi:glycosyltransferase involved in cell wall biosynthesis
VRVLVVSSYPPRHCGIGSYARDQVARLRDAGDEVTVLSPPDGDGDIRTDFLGGDAFAKADVLAPEFDRIVIHFQPALYYPPRRPLSKIRTSRMLLQLARRHGGKLEILVHEADRPELWRPDYLILRRAFHRAGRVSFHTKAEWSALERQYRVRVRGAVVPHRVHAASPVSRHEARERLGIEEPEGPVFVCAGFLQPSKGFDRAVAAFAAMAATGGGANGARLYIVGSVRDGTPENQAHRETLRAAAAATDGVIMVDQFLPDEQFDLWIAAADRLVLPYRSSWSSGVLARAHELKTPAIVADVGGLREQAEGQDMVFEDDEGLRSAMAEASR